jgi:hypothetical protein
VHNAAGDDEAGGSQTMITARKMRALENDGGNASAGAGKKVFKPL